MPLFPLSLLLLAKALESSHHTPEGPGGWPEEHTPGALSGPSALENCCAESGTILHVALHVGASSFLAYGLSRLSGGGCNLDVDKVHSACLVLVG